jgi:hypothetical protein
MPPRGPNDDDDEDEEDEEDEHWNAKRMRKTDEYAARARFLPPSYAPAAIRRRRWHSVYN